ncbi:hypothetical protein DAPPUDRAFT_258461 [Daphnia pulex]|uniref:Uncharacterized protein n=1 Tax=Daphnia pulex TaxID=6669 RepID=E9HFG2_DAPPU|nr:hypothetical protein DAPPUDRAFT_258461 [Daphnia pulex]|eukprot:EFX69539.1 hypothetical protein DAPPUDRAFT_258461 [Daphnia pulex]
MTSIEKEKKGGILETFKLLGFSKFPLRNNNYPSSNAPKDNILGSYMSYMTPRHPQIHALSEIIIIHRSCSCSTMHQHASGKRKDCEDQPPALLCPAHYNKEQITKSILHHLFLNCYGYAWSN